MARFWPSLNRSRATRLVRSCLLTGLVLTTSFPAPASLRAVLSDAMSVPSEGQDSLPGDSESPERESARSELDLLPPARRRSPWLSALEGGRPSRLFWPWTMLAADRPPTAILSPVDSDGGRAGHFLADGRALRLWFQSYTC